MFSRSATKRLGVFTLFALLVSAPLFGQVEDFSFLHFSDVHVSPVLSEPGSLEGARSYECVRGAAGLGETTLEPYGVTAPPPAFAIVTGDVTEYGWPDYTEDVVDQYFDGVTDQVYHCVGNHDNTWVSPSKIFRERFGGMNYAFDHGGVRFIGFQTATFQEPLPSIGVEALRFISDTLEDTPPEMPVIVFCHHPLAGLASEYESDLFLQELRGHNVLAILVGHHHSTKVDDYDGIPGIHGGSPFMKGREEGQPDKSGYTVFTVKEGKLLAAHKYIADENPSKGLAEIPLSGHGNYPEITFTARPSASSPGTATLQASIGDIDTELKEARLKIDGEVVYTSEGTKEAEFEATDLGAGSHALRVEFETADGKLYFGAATCHIGQTNLPDQGSTIWRTHLAGSSQAAPVIDDGVLYVGSNDGAFQALDTKDGTILWRKAIGAEIVGEAVVYKNTVLFGSADGNLYALAKDTGGLLWKADTGKPIYSTPVIDSDIAYIGNNAAELVAINAETGELLWKNDAADYSVEVPPTVADGVAYYGAWGGKVYAVKTSDGELAWSELGPRCQEQNSRYYAPADAPVVALNGKLYVTDRGYTLGAYETDGTYAGKLAGLVSALTPATDGTGLIVRRLKGGTAKLSWTGEEIWVSPAEGGHQPIPPTVTADAIYVCSNTGKLQAINPENGEITWTYQVTPQQYVFSQVTADQGIVYTIGMDGAVTAIRPPTSEPKAGM